MKKSKGIISILIIMLISSVAIGQGYDRSKDWSAEQHQIVAVFADRVNLRESPNVDSKVLTKLSLGTLVEVVKRTNIPLTLEGRTENWVEVKTGYYTGYLWGGLLAKYAMRSERNPEVLFMLKQADEGARIRLKVVKGNALLQDKYFEGLTANEQLYGLYTAGAKGLSGVHDLVAVNYIGEFCGATSGQLYLAWDGSTLRRLISVGSSGDGGFSDVESVIFPSDLMGEKNLIHYYHTSEEYEDEETDQDTIINQTTTHKVYRWDGEQLVEIK